MFRDGVEEATLPCGGRAVFKSLVTKGFRHSPPGRVERSEERVFVAVRDATLVGEVNIAINRSTSPRFARPHTHQVKPSVRY